MQYIILVGQHPTELEEKVKNYLSSGWNLQGGVSISQSASKTAGGFDDLIYAQAVIKINP